MSSGSRIPPQLRRLESVPVADTDSLVWRDGTGFERPAEFD